jgi:hypothetical protein
MGKVKGSWAVLLITCIFAYTARAQVITGVIAQQEGQNIVIHYHLETYSPISIQLWMSENGGGTWTQIEEGVSGDLLKVTSGDHSVLWNVLSVREQFVGNNVVFKLKSINTNVQVKVGENYQGGIVAYILRSGDKGYIKGEVHGLIAAPQDMPRKYQWGCYGKAITGANEGYIGSGAQNTEDIVKADCGEAAKACADLSLNGYDDWFLPSYEELAQLYENRILIGANQDFRYWTSSEYYLGSAWLVDFNNGQTITTFKNKYNYVRPVRAF